jgi:hypothetical protein
LIVVNVVQLAEDVSQHRLARIEAYVKLPKRVPMTMNELQPLETQHRIILLYLWLRQVDALSRD